MAGLDPAIHEAQQRLLVDPRVKPGDDGWREITMGLAVAIQMDPIDTINIDADSTFALALEGQARGHALYHYLPQALTLRGGRLFARGRPLEVFRQHGNHHRFGEF